MIDFKKIVVCLTILALTKPLYLSCLAGVIYGGVNTDISEQLEDSGYKAAHPEAIPRNVNAYTKQDFINVWCDGKQHVGEIDCLTDKYATIFYPVSDWERAIEEVTKYAEGIKQIPVAVLMVTDPITDIKYMQEAKRMAKQQRKIIIFTTINAGIPADWIP